MKPKTYVLVLLVVVLFCGLFLLSKNLLKKENQVIQSEPTIPTITQDAPITTLDMNNLTSQLNQLVLDSFSEQERQSISFSLYIPSFDYAFDDNDTLEFFNASIIKVPLNMYIYELAANDPSILTKEIQYLLHHYEDGTGVMQNVELGTFFDVQTLLNYSIVYSDNIATNMLFDAFIDNIFICDELVPYYGEANYQDWVSTSKNKMQALRYLYAHQQVFSTLIDDMTSTIFKNRIPNDLPKTLKVANKTGDMYASIHDLAIVFDPNGYDYLLTISFDAIEDGDNRMALLSSNIYNLIQSAISFHE